MTVTRTIVADDLTPVRAYAALRATDPESASFLFETVLGGDRWGRYSIVGYRPRHEVVLDRDGWSVVPRRGEARVTLADAGDDSDPIRAIEPLFRVDPTLDRSTVEPFAHAHVGYLAWDLVHLVDKVPAGDSAVWDSHYTPVARFLGGCVVVIFDSFSQTVTIAGETEEELDAAARAIANAPALPAIAVPDRCKLPADVTVDVSDDAYEANVRRAQEYIAAGDAFQVVLARTFTVPQGGRDPFHVYRAMRLVNPSPYMYFMDLPAIASHPSRLQVMGASPETMVHLRDRQMVVRPLAGTRPRGGSDEEDLALEAEMLADPKERAEHVMLIDLGRNDVGRVAETGTVKLTRTMEVERYSHVMHMVSEVAGRVPETTPPLEVVRAAFPAGTLSGAPKVRAMQIIRELEARPRGLYGGAVGWASTTGDLDFAIAIRTAVCHNGRFEVTAGAGIVEASVPASEALETRNKARAVLCAIEAATPHESA